ncbi:hypothetical protein GQ457_01G004640 [Hibiscus cannabinus]
MVRFDSESSSSSSSSSSFSCLSSSRQKYDVFLSFRGEDTRKNFTDHLYAALKRRGIITFRDDEKLKVGEAIAPELFKAIRESWCSVVVLSEGYAFSSWCLEELSEIMQQKNDRGHKVFPIFYHVDPSDLRKQRGKVKEAFAKHERILEDSRGEKIQRWRLALTQVANIKGWHLNERFVISDVWEGNGIISRLLPQKKVLIVIDDADNIQHLLCLIGKRGRLGLGSRIIITTRDEHLLQIYGVDVVYKPMELNAKEALRLFSLKAFRSETPSLSTRENLGSFLSGGWDEAQWRSAIERLKKESKKKIVDKLRISFDESKKKIVDKLRINFTMVFIVYTDFQATEAVQGIASGRTGVQSKTLALSADAFLKMKRLRVLRVFNAPTPSSRDLNYLSNELRLLEWHGYPFKSFPSTFHPENLPLPMLRSVDLKGCENLVKTPDFSMVPNLESLVLEGTRIADFHPSLMFLRRLKILSLKDCKSVRSFPSKIGKESLETLILSGCSKIKRIPETVGEMECLRELCLDETAIKELPSSVGHLRSLELLSLNGCSKLETIPDSIGGCQLLENLNLCGCSKIENLPENLQQIKSLKRLDLSETDITSLPAFILLDKRGSIHKPTQGINFSFIIYLPKIFQHIFHMTAIFLIMQSS